MPDPQLTAVSAIEHLWPRHHDAAGAEPGVTLTEATHMALATVMARKDAGALAARIGEAFGLDLPMTPRRAASGTVGFAWAGPNQWLASSENEPGHRFEARLREACGGLASTSDQSHGRTVLRISGPRARDTLAKSVPLDLHPREFRPGDAAVTLAGHIGIHLWQIDDGPTYECAVFRSYAVSLLELLIASAAEFGLSMQRDEVSA